MDINQLVNFQTIARMGNLTKAADSLHISQSAMSASLSRLEDELCIQLFDRQGRRLILNEQGQKFLDYANRALTDYRSIVRELSPDAQARKIVTVYVVDRIGINEILPAFTKAHPDCLLRVIEIERKNVPQVLAREDCDFIGDSYVVRMPNLTCGYQIVLEDAIALIVSKHNHFFDRESLRMEDLREEKFVTLPFDSPCQSLMDEECRRAGFNRRVVAQCSRSQTVDYIIGSDAVAFTSSSEANDPNIRLMSDHLRIIPIDTDKKVYHVLLWSEGRPFSEMASAFLNMTQRAQRRHGRKEF